MKKSLPYIKGRPFVIPFINEYRVPPGFPKATEEQMKKRLIAETGDKKIKRDYEIFKLTCDANGEFMEDLRE